MDPVVYTKVFVPCLRATPFAACPVFAKVKVYEPDVLLNKVLLGKVLSGKVLFYEVLFGKVLLDKVFFGEILFDRIYHD